MQQDIGRQVTALRRALGAPLRSGGAGRATALATGLTALWFATTFGTVAVTGALPEPLAQRLPEGMSLPLATFGMFLTGAILIALATWVAAGLAMALRSRSTTRALPPGE
jgi:heme/copper-type cytochrome/quinol oxidase subunit 1